MSVTPKVEYCKNEEMRGEAKEVYGLAKDWLADVTTEKRK